MASTITNFSSVIDAQFPVPGQDNDTQGFRNNFSNIRDSLGAAAAEITDLQVTNIGIINSLNNFVNPTNFNGDTVTATTIRSTSIVNAGSISTNDLTSVGDISTNGKFIGDGSLLSNIPINNVTSIGTLTNISVRANLNLGIAVISTANNYFNVSGVNQLYFADNKFHVVPKLFDNGTKSGSSITLYRSSGTYQTVTLDASASSVGTSISVVDWPTGGTLSSMLLEVKFTGVSAVTPNTEFRSSCTTYGTTSTTVSIDDWVGNVYNGTSNLRKGYGVYSTSVITTSTPVLTTIDSIVNERTITVFPGYNFVKGTSYYFAPLSTSALPYKVTLTTSTGQTLKVESTINAENLFNTTSRGVYHLYSYDGGATIFFRQLDVYNS